MSLQIINIDSGSKISKVEQLVRAIAHQIETGHLLAGERLPSITDFSKQFKISRDTVEKAYRVLREEGFVDAIPGRGNYISDSKDRRLKVLLLFNKLSSYKKNVYYAFIDALGKNAKVDLQIYHYDTELFREIVLNALGNYHYYVVMPYFTKRGKVTESIDLLKLIPPAQLIVLDKNISGLKGKYSAVYQDFKMDIYEALKSDIANLKKYSTTFVVFPPEKNYQSDIIQGVEMFCEETESEFLKIENLTDTVPSPGQLFITLAEADLADLVNKVRSLNLKPGKDIGIISFNDTILKELLNISVVTTDFEQMGMTAAQLITKRKSAKVRNPFKLIKRESL